MVVVQSFVANCTLWTEVCLYEVALVFSRASRHPLMMPRCTSVLQQTVDVVHAFPFSECRDQADALHCIIWYIAYRACLLPRVMLCPSQCGFEEHRFEVSAVPCFLQHAWTSSCGTCPLGPCLFSKSCRCSLCPTGFDTIGAIALLRSTSNHRIIGT